MQGRKRGAVFDNWRREQTAFSAEWMVGNEPGVPRSLSRTVGGACEQQQTRSWRSSANHHIALQQRQSAGRENLQRAKDSSTDVDAQRARSLFASTRLQSASKVSTSVHCAVASSAALLRSLFSTAIVTFVRPAGDRLFGLRIAARSTPPALSA